MLRIFAAMALTTTIANSAYSQEGNVSPPVLPEDIQTELTELLETKPFPVSRESATGKHLEDSPTRYRILNAFESLASTASPAAAEALSEVLSERLNLNVARTDLEQPIAAQWSGHAASVSLFDDQKVYRLLYDPKAGQAPAISNAVDFCTYRCFLIAFDSRRTASERIARLRGLRILFRCLAKEGMNGSRPEYQYLAALCALLSAPDASDGAPLLRLGMNEIQNLNGNLIDNPRQENILQGKSEWTDYTTGIAIAHYVLRVPTDSKGKQLLENVAGNALLANDALCLACLHQALADATIGRSPVSALKDQRALFNRDPSAFAISGRKPKFVFAGVLKHAIDWTAEDGISALAEDFAKDLSGEITRDELKHFQLLANQLTDLRATWPPPNPD